MRKVRNAENIETYEYNSKFPEITAGVTMATMFKLLRNVGTNDWLTLMIDEEDQANPNLMNVSFENQSQDNFTVIRFPQLTKKQNYIGAKIEVFFMDNSVQLHELYAGSGYLSQSAPILFFASNEKELRVKRIEIRWPDG